MKKALLFCTLILLTGFDLKCQTGLRGMPDSKVYAGPVERIRLFTDRNLYCVNENIFFKAYYSCSSEADSISWSKVLYVELIKWNGFKLINLKLKLDKSGSSASLHIPGNLPSGNYYLRAYTKWMRNFSVNDYGYCLIKIVNPFNADLDIGPEGITDGISKLSPSYELIQGIHCAMNKSRYQPREKAVVELYINNDQTDVCHDFCVSVAKVGSLDTSLLFLKPERETPQIILGDLEYLPEIWGNTLSGRIIDKTSNAPKNDILVSLSEPSNGEFFSVYQTRDNGRFVFSIPDLYGKYDLFIQSDASDIGLSKFLIDNCFCNRPVTLPYIAFSLNENEKSLIREMMVNMQLNDKFLRPADTKILQNNRHQPFAFYGSGKHTYYTGKYIELPNIEEFFIEIVQETYVVHNQGKSGLKIKGSTGFSNYPPLILLDNIQVNNDDRLLKLPLDKIERVQVIENGYMVGNIMYSGLISIFSKNKDLAGMDLNKNSMSFTFDLFSDKNADFSFGETSYDSRAPDRRNLLYWNPEIHPSPGEKTTISFFTSDNKGDYVVYVLGKMNGEGSDVYGKCFFSVK